MTENAGMRASTVEAHQFSALSCITVVIYGLISISCTHEPWKMCLTKTKKWQIQDSKTCWQKNLWLLDAKITQKWALIPIKNACNILRLGQNFARPTLFEVPFYTPASHPFVHLLVVTVVLHVFSDKVIEIIEIANYGPAHSPTRACWITFRGLFNSCQVPENISVNAWLLYGIKCLIEVVF